VSDLIIIHPGEILFSESIGVSPIRISQILRGERAITVDTAMRLARYFGTSAAVWLRLQVRYELESAKDTLGPRIDREVKVFHHSK
jgi:addiction module HigA family antidote